MPGKPKSNKISPLALLFLVHHDIRDRGDQEETEFEELQKINKGKKESKIKTRYHRCLLSIDDGQMRIDDVV